MANIPKVTRCMFSRLFSSSLASIPKPLSSHEASLMKLDDWTPPLIASVYPLRVWSVDFGCWSFKFAKTKHLRHYSDQELYDHCAEILGKGVGSKEAAKEKIYAIARGPKSWGFCARVDKETALKVGNQRECNVAGVSPDFYCESRPKAPTTRKMRE